VNSTRIHARPPTHGGLPHAAFGFKELKIFHVVSSVFIKIVFSKWDWRLAVRRLGGWLVAGWLGGGWRVAGWRVAVGGWQWQLAMAVGGWRDERSFFMCDRPSEKLFLSIVFYPGMRIAPKRLDPPTVMVFANSQIANNQ